MAEGREAAPMNSNSRKFSNIWKTESSTNINAFTNIWLAACQLTFIIIILLILLLIILLLTLKYWNICCENQGKSCIISPVWDVNYCLNLISVLHQCCCSYVHTSDTQAQRHDGFQSAVCPSVCPSVPAFPVNVISQKRSEGFSSNSAQMVLLVQGWTDSGGPSFWCHISVIVSSFSFTPLLCRGNWWVSGLSGQAPH